MVWKAMMDSSWFYFARQKIKELKLLDTTNKMGGINLSIVSPISPCRVRINILFDSGEKY